MTRTGKIARLPWEVREELNRRLRDGEPGGPLLAWLNPDQDVQEVLREHFGGQPINKQNLSDWRQGGYRDWQRHQESLDLVRTLSEQGDELLEVTDGEAVSDRLSAVLTTELVRTAQAVLDEVTDPAERWRQLRELRRELAELRKDDHRAARLKLDRDEAKREEEERREAERQADLKRMKDYALAPIRAAMRMVAISEVFKDDPAMRDACAIMFETDFDLPEGFLGRASSTAADGAPVKASQGESSLAEPPATGAAADGPVTGQGPVAAPPAGSPPKPAGPVRPSPASPTGAPAQPVWAAAPDEAGATGQKGREGAGRDGDERPRPQPRRPEAAKAPPAGPGSGIELIRPDPTESGPWPRNRRPRRQDLSGL